VDKPDLYSKSATELGIAKDQGRHAEGAAREDVREEEKGL